MYKRIILTIIVLSLGLIMPLQGFALDVPNTFTSGTVIKSADVNENFTDIYAAWTKSESNIVYAEDYNSGALTDVTIQAAITAIGNTTPKVIQLKAGNWVLGSNIDTSSTKILIKMAQGAYFSGSGNFTGTVIAEPTQQIFSTSYTGTPDLINDIIPVQWFGAVGDASTDDYAAIANAIKAATPTSTGKKTLYFPAVDSTGYAISEIISIPKNVITIMDSPVRYTGTDDTAILTVGSTTTVNNTTPLKLSVTRVTQSDWSNLSNIGIKILNSYTSNINIVQALNNTIGVQFLGDSTGFSYNNVTLGSLMNNKIGIDCNNQNSGWCNENVFFGGRFGVTSDLNAGESAYGIKISSIDDSYLGNNNNLFIKPSFELNESGRTGGKHSYPMIVEHGLYNEVISARSEDNYTYGVIFNNDSAYNYFETGYGVLTADDNSTNQNNTVTNRQFRDLNIIGQKTIYNSGPLHKNTVDYDGTNYHTANVSGVDYTTGTETAYNSASAVAATYLELPTTEALGVWVDTSVVKKFVIRRDVDASYPGRIYVNAYDSGGSLLTGTSPYYATSTSATLLSWWAARYGGSYGLGSDTANDILLTVHDDVKKIRINISGGTAALRIRSFNISTLAGKDAAVYQGYEQVAIGQNIATAIPTNGTYAVGKIIFNVAGAVGDPVGWYCTVAGSPGTWVAFGRITATQTGVSAMTNLTAPSNLDADTVTTAELADIVGNLITKLRTAGIVGN